MQGKKTYLVAIAYGIVTALKILGVITPEQASAIEGALVAMGIVTMRAAVGKAIK